MTAALERELDSLYQQPLDRFTAARNELAKRLRADGQVEQAEQVKALRKPTVTVWLVNRLAREDELDVHRLLKAGETLTTTQAALARGQSREGFLKAQQDEQRALERLTRAAHKLAAREGVGSSAVDRATQTLRAASLTDKGRQLLERGRLTEELEPPGFEALAGLTSAPTKQASDGSRQPTTRSNPGVLKKARDSLRRARAEQRRLRTAARAAERAAVRAETDARRMRQEADDAQSAADKARIRVEAAEAEIERLGRPS